MNHFFMTLNFLAFLGYLLITVVCIKVRTASIPRFWKNHPLCRKKWKKWHYIPREVSYRPCSVLKPGDFHTYALWIGSSTVQNANLFWKFTIDETTLKSSLKILKLMVFPYCPDTNVSLLSNSYIRSMYYHMTAFWAVLPFHSGIFHLLLNNSLIIYWLIFNTLLIQC